MKNIWLLKKNLSRCQTHAQDGKQYRPAKESEHCMYPEFLQIMRETGLKLGWIRTKITRG
jgi:hypothetical protein